MTEIHKSRGHIVFDAMTEPDFRELVRQTLEQSEFIDTHWVEGEGRERHQRLIVEEVYENRWDGFFEGEAGEELI